MGAIKQILSAPLFVGELADKINEVVATANKVEGLKAGSGIAITVSEGGIVISTDGTGGGSGLPSGYGPEEWTVYDGGVVTTRNFLTDNPD